MNESTVLYRGRDDVLYVVDPTSLPHLKNEISLIDIVVAVINAGYQGVAVDEKQLANGLFMHCLNVNAATPEGKIIQNVALTADAGTPLPSPKFVLAQIKKEYDAIGVGHE